RIGHAFSVHYKLQKYLLQCETSDEIITNEAITTLQWDNTQEINQRPRNNSFQDTKQLEQLLQHKYIFGVTSVSAGSSPILHNMRFDYCLVDEAGQVYIFYVKCNKMDKQLTEPQVLGPIRKAQRFILVGDSNQLPPLVKNKIALKNGMNISLFQRLSTANSHCVASLSIQYRMNEDILSLANQLIYKNQMKCATLDVASQSLSISSLDIAQHLDKCQYSQQIREWLRYALDPSKKVVFLNTDKLYPVEDIMPNNEAKTNANEKEAEIVKLCVNGLLECNVKSCQIGVMSPFVAQLKMIEAKLQQIRAPVSPSQQRRFENSIYSQILHNSQGISTNVDQNMLLDTIDRFQGRDCDVIILSLKHTPLDRKVASILHDWRRVNVALTRAKKKLIVIGSEACFLNIALESDKDDGNRKNLIMKHLMLFLAQKYPHNIAQVCF
ncbi:hypothetical protein RFI_36167, partial [Reticulomyxa filosa]